MQSKRPNSVSSCCFHSQISSPKSLAWFLLLEHLSLVNRFLFPIQHQHFLDAPKLSEESNLDLRKGASPRSSMSSTFLVVRQTQKSSASKTWIEVAVDLVVRVH